MADIKKEYERWLENATADADVATELKTLDDTKIEDAFYRDLAFGTGGLRGVIGAGTNRMNIYTVAKASQGLADYLKKNFTEPSVAIGYDSRIKSDVFAKVAAGVFSANGVKVNIWPVLMPVPTVSFATRYLHTSAGVMITASHNPSKYNGYKVYGADGCQITTEAAAEILAEIEKLDIFTDVKHSDFEVGLANGNIKYIPDEVYTAFVNEVKNQSVLFGEEVNKDVAIVYSPLNGTGLKPVTRTLKEMGYTNITVVKEQEQPDGNFPTCPYPNPEIKEAMTLGMEYSIMVPMRNLLNDAYCRDISVKIKSQLAVKRKRGDFVGSFAAFGYRKDPANHTRLIVDELAAETVQDIFRWKISGMNNQGIADRLNAEKVPSPAARKLQSGAKLSLHFRKSDEPPWSAKAVDRILHNEVYTGKLVQGKTRRLDYRSKKKMNVPMRDWTIVDNTHEAIIPAEQFELVQRILETETRRPNDAETVALFAGFLYCGDCGSRLVRRSASYKGKRYIYYQCSGSKQNKGSCTSHNLRDEKLYNIVRNALQMQIQIVMEEAEFVESIRQAQQEPYRVRRIERQIRQLTAEKAHTQGIKEKLYGDYADEILTREDFLNYNELYSNRIEEYDRKITELEAERQNLQTAPNAYPFLDVYRKYRKLEEITRPMVVELIEKIEVYEGNRVEITFRFHDEIADLLEELHQKQMGQHEVSA